MGLTTHGKGHLCSGRSSGWLDFGKEMEVGVLHYCKVEFHYCGTVPWEWWWGAGPLPAWRKGTGRCHTPVKTPRTQLAYSRARAELSGDHGITDLLSAGAHRRLLLSRPPPRRTVRTLLEKQNWGVRHRDFAASPIPVLR